MIDFIITALVCFAGLAGYAGLMILCEQYDEKRDTRTIQSYKPQLFLSSKMPNYGGYEPVEGWLVTLSNGTKVALKKLYNDSGRVKTFTPTIGERAHMLVHPDGRHRIPFAEIAEISA